MVTASCGRSLCCSEFTFVGDKSSSLCLLLWRVKNAVIVVLNMRRCSSVFTFECFRTHLHPTHTQH